MDYKNIIHHLCELLPHLPQCTAYLVDDDENAKTLNDTVDYDANRTILGNIANVGREYLILDMPMNIYRAVTNYAPDYGINANGTYYPVEIHPFPDAQLLLKNADFIAPCTYDDGIYNYIVAVFNVDEKIIPIQL